MHTKLARYVATLAFVGVVGAQAASPTAPQGVITAKEYLGIPGVAVADLTNHAKFPNNPDVVGYPSLFEWPTNNDPTQNPPGNVKADYGVQIMGYFFPETSGDYNFYLSADDGAVLYLSTDDNPANKRAIATEPQWNGVRDYLGTARRPINDTTGLPVNQSGPINLVANRAYYIEALMKEGGGGDNLSVAAVAASEGLDPTHPILGARLAPFDDGVAPTLKGAVANKAGNAITLTFSEGLQEASAETLANFTVSPALNVTGATLINPTTVRLATAAQTAGTEYTVSVSNVRDLSGTSIAANASAKATALIRQSGWVGVEVFDNIGTVNLDELLIAEKFINNQPDRMVYAPNFSSPSGIGDNYGARVSGWLMPDVTGDYHFFIRADDQAALFINPNGEALPDHSSTALAVATELSACCEAFKETDLGELETTQTPIRLTAGQKYGVVLLVKEGGGGDWAEVAWRRVGDTTPASSLRPIPGSFIESIIDISNASVTINTQPANTNVFENRGATFSVSATGTGTAPLAYQWLKNGQPIVGANGSSYSIAAVPSSDNNAKFSVRVSVPGKTVTSSEATLTVTTDNTPPTVVSAGALAGASTVGVLFSELVDPTTATATANYTIAGRQISEAKLHRGRIVELTLDNAVGSTFNVAVSNVKDLAGNTIAAATVNGQISDLTAEDINFPILPGKTFSWGTGYYVAGGGNDIWNNQDMFHYAYKQVTGAFDARVRHDALIDLVPQDAWSKMGIMVRESLEPGSRNVMVLSTRNEGNGQNQFNFQWRDTLDGGSGSNADAQRIRPVVYPSITRIVRETANTNAFKAYVSLDDGQTWRDLGTHLIPGDPLPATLYVGLGTTSHGNADVQSNGEPEVLAEGYYSNFTVMPFTAEFNPNLTVGTSANGQVTITWQTGTLVSADNAAGPYSPVANATSPMSITPSGNAKFYRVRQ